MVHRRRSKSPQRQSMLDPGPADVPHYYEYTTRSKQNRIPAKMSKVLPIALGCILMVVFFVAGFLIGFFVRPPKNFEPDESIQQKLLKEISAINIEKHLRFLTSEPHLSGTEGDERVVKYIKDFWKSLKMDVVTTVPYEILLSSPDRTDPNLVSIHAENDTIIAQSRPFEPVLRPEQNDSRIVPPFNAYSPPGVVKGNLVYINYGRVSDFELAVSKGLPINGSICLIRYGFNFRADKVALSEKYGCIGTVMYTDPADYAVNSSTKVYPDSWWLPEGAVQRGTIKISSGGLGDPLTPFYPATESAHRLNITEADLPKIPCHAIGYGDAKKLFRYMDGDEVPSDWRGGLDVVYRFGTSLKSPASYVKLKVSTHSYMGTIRNIFAIIRGSLEPDRYVLVGNHHDAWVFGGVDPSSGTSVMLEMSRAFSRMVEQGWRPHRTIIFCAWGAEEHGVIGSREWVEEFGQILSHRAIAYLNVDNAVQGRHVFRGRGLPLLKDVMFEAAKTVPNPDKAEVRHGRTNVYDTWYHRAPESELRLQPSVPLIGSGSDFAPFVSSLGVSSADLRYSYDSRLNISSYPLYHTGYETFHLYSNFHDPGFLYSKATAQLWAEMARRLADTLVLPLKVEDMTAMVTKQFKEFKKKHRHVLSSNNITLDHLASGVSNFTESAKEFRNRLDQVDENDLLLVRQYNEQLIHLERAFIDPAGLPGRPSIRNVLYAPSKYNSYSATVFPGVVDAIFAFQHSKENDKEQLVDEIRRQVSILTFFVQSAADVLKHPSDFIRDA